MFCIVPLRHSLSLWLAVGRASAAYGAGFVGGHLCPTFSIQTSGEKQEEDISRIRTGFDWRSFLSSGVTAASGAGVVGGVVYPTPRIQSTHEKQEETMLSKKCFRML